MYIGSADLMARNLDSRIEVLTPIIDKDIFNVVKAMLQLQFEDTVKARIINENQSNEFISNTGKYHESSQHKTYAYLVDNNIA